MRNNRTSEFARNQASIATRFPAVQNLSVKLEFFSPQQQLLNEEIREFGPNDSCEFSVPCPGRCGQGSADLEGKIMQVVGSRQDRSESRGTCLEPIYAGATEVCGCVFKCTLEISYL